MKKERNKQKRKRGRKSVCDVVKMRKKLNVIVNCMAFNKTVQVKQ